jgi:hypothetical protein
MTRGAHHHSTFAPCGNHLAGDFLNDLKIGQDIDAKGPLD